MKTKQIFLIVFLITLFLYFAVALAQLIAPRNLSAVPVSSYQINLTWVDTNKSETGYSIERSLGSTSGFVVVGTTPKNVTTYSDTGLASGTTYYYRVKTINRKESSPYSDIASATTGVTQDTIPPSVPTGLAATAVSCSQIDLSWNASSDSGRSGLKGYNIYRNGSFLKQVSTTLMSDTRLLASTNYSYTVSAVDNVGNESSQGSASSATTPACPDTTAPSVPVGLTALAVSCSQIDLSWNASSDTGGSGLAGYKVYRNGGFLKQVSTASTSDTGLVASTSYSYTVSAVDTTGNQSAQSSVASATTPACGDTTPPSAPTGLTATAVSCSQVNLSWNASTDTGGSGLKGYNVYRNGSYLKQVSTASTSDTGLAASTSYSYTVSAVDNAGNQSAQSSAASAITPACPDTTAPSVPTGLIATAASCSQVSLSWGASTDTGGSELKGYNVYRNSVYLKQVLAPTTSTSDTGLAASTVYSYIVLAVDNAGNQSAQSNTAMANTPACSDTIAPSVPTGLTATAVSSSQINLSWNASTDTGGSGLAGYKIYRDGSYIGTTTATSYSDTGLAVNMQYCYTVAAYDNGGNTSAQSAQACASTQLTGEWSRSSGSPGDDRGRSVAVDSSGNMVMTGWFSGTVDFGGGPLTTVHFPWMDPNQLKDIFLAKYSSSGVHLWSKQLGSESNDYGYGVAVGGNGDVVVTGACTNSVDFGNGVPTNSQGGTDIFVAKYSGVDGSYVWAKRFGGIYDDYGYGVAVDSSGNVVITGLFTGTVDFGGGPLTSKGTMDVFVAKFSASGLHVWSRSFGSAGTSSYGYGIGVDGTGNVFVVGRFTGAVDFGGGMLTSAGQFDIFLAKYSGANGNHLWSKRLGSTNYDYGMSIAVDGSGNVVITGSFQGVVDFGGGLLTSAGSSDIFLAKYSGANGSHLWSKRFGDTGSDSGNGVAVDSSGNIIVTGSFNGTVDFGGGSLTSSGGSDIFVVKFSASGSHVWSERFGVGLEQYGSAVAAKGGSNIAVTGYFQNIVDFGGGPLISAGIWDIFLVSLMP